MQSLSVPLLTSTPSFFFFNDTATTEIYTLSLHDALPISRPARPSSRSWRSPPSSTRNAAPNSPSRTRDTSPSRVSRTATATPGRAKYPGSERSEEHTSELQSHSDLVCRLLLEKKKQIDTE